MKALSIVALAAILLLLAIPALAAHPTIADIQHSDHRSTPKLQFEPAVDYAVVTDGESTARSFRARARLTIAWRPA